MSATINTTTYGVTPTGFVKMRMVDIQAQIVASLVQSIQQITGDTTATVDTDPDTVIGQLISVIAEREASIWEVAEGVYNAMYPVSASDVSLDNAVSFAGVTRLQDSYTTVYAVCYGTEGTQLPQLFGAALASNQIPFTLANALVITATATVDISIQITNATLLSYNVIINGVEYSTPQYTANPGVNQVISDLATALASSGLTITSTSLSIRIQAPDYQTTFSATLSTGLGATSIGSPGEFVCTEVGPIVVVEGDLINATSTAAGFSNMYNFLLGNTGQYQETDTALRARYNNGVYQLGAAVLTSIKANLINNVAGVTNAIVIPNNTSSALSTGQPANSVECVVTGGTNAAIAQELLSLVAGGIQTWGTTTVNVTTSDGSVYPISFSRPSTVYVWVNCVYSLNEDEVFPSNGISAIAQQIDTYGNSLGSGKDIVNQKFMGPIYENVTGIGGLTITMATSSSLSSPPASSAYSSANIEILNSQTSSFDLSRITVS